MILKITIMRLTFLLIMYFAAVSAVMGAGVESRELTVTGRDGLRMGATLTAPDTPRAAIVLATGSGTQDRDETVFGKKPFKTIADFLGERGYAVLRVDDRGFGNAADAEAASFDTYASDVMAAHSLLDSIYPDIPVGILGHSCGGSYAVTGASRSPETVDFIITMAAPAVAGDSLVMQQSRAIAVAMTGRWDAEELQRQIMSVAKSQMPAMTARPLIISMINQSLGSAVALMPQVREQVEAQADGVLSPFYRGMLRYDPSADIAAVSQPWLALNGAKDTQVDPSNLDVIKRLNPAAETVTLDGHNHLFQADAVTGLLQEYATLPGDISPLTLETIARWLERKVK